MTNSRYILIAKNISGAAAARGINLIVTALMVPLTLNALSPADYAILSMAISFSVLIGFADLGLGLSIVNHISSAVDTQTQKDAQVVLSTVWVVLFAISGCGVLFLTSYYIFITTTGAVLTQSSLAIMASGFLIFLGLPAGIAQQLMFAKQHSYIASIWQTVGRILALAWTWWIVSNIDGGLFYLLFGVLGIPMIISWVSLAWLSRSGLLGDISLALRFYLKSKVLPSIKTGIRYLIIQVAPYVETGIDVLIIGYFVGLSGVPAYDVYSKLFMYIVALMSMIVSPVWPAIANARATGEVLLARRMAWISLYGASISAALIAISFGIWAKEIVGVWTGKSLEIDTLVLLGFICFSVIASLGVAQSNIINAYGLIKTQSKLIVVYSIVVLIAKVICLIEFGTVGLIWALCVLSAGRALLFQILLTKQDAKSI